MDEKEKFELDNGKVAVPKDRLAELMAPLKIVVRVENGKPDGYFNFFKNIHYARIDN